MQHHAVAGAGVCMQLSAVAGAIKAPCALDDCLLTDDTVQQLLL